MLLFVERLGSPDDLSARIEQLQKGGPVNFPAYFPLHVLPLDAAWPRQVR